MYFYLIRHGQSEGNVASDKQGIVHGKTDASNLTENGKKQVVDLVKKLKEIYQKDSFILWYSPTQRTKETVNIITQYLSGIKTQSCDLLYDIDFGKFENQTWQEIVDKYPSWLNDFRKDRLNTPFINGESKKDLQKRVNKFVKTQIMNSSYKNHIIITHEEVIRTFLSLDDNNPLYYYSRDNFQIPNGSLSIILFYNKDKVILQVGKKNVPPIINVEKIVSTYEWYKSEKGKINEFIPRKSFSDNTVFTARIDKNRETVKMIPLEFIQDVKKDIHLSENLSKLELPAPKYLKFQIVNNHVFIIRSYLPGKIAEDWLNSNKYKHQALTIIGWILKKIHQLNLDNLKIKVYSPKSWKKDFLIPWIKADIDVLKKIKYPETNGIEKFYTNFIKILSVNDTTLLHNDLSSHNIAMIKQDDKLYFSGIWDFERAFSGDPLWDLAVTQKISFFKKTLDFILLLKTYLDKNTIENQTLTTINAYTLMNTTGAIRYRFERKRNIQEEINNLEYFFSGIKNPAQSFLQSKKS